MKILRIGCLFGGFLTLVLSLSAQTFTTLHSFDGTDGANPNAALIQATNGDLYGTTSGGGANGNGTVFQVTPSGKLTTLYSFCSQSGCTDGAVPLAALIQATNGDIYGTASGGGASGNGTVFKMTPDGKVTTLHSFCSRVNCLDGSYPIAGLVQDTDGNFYGTTENGGATNGGTVFNMTLNGKVTTLYSFTGGADGANPYAGIVQAAGGNFYGTTQIGGDSDGRGGTVFKITPSGMLTTLQSFGNCGYGCSTVTPKAGLLQDTGGNFYGTTFFGDCWQYGDCNGSVFEMTPSGTIIWWEGFPTQKDGGCAGSDVGANPNAALIRASDEELYGTTTSCGVNNQGTIFQSTPSGTLASVYSFCSQSGCTDGEDPQAALVQDTNGTFYGTTWSGGANGDGTVFSLSIGLGPFVKTLPAAAKVGAEVGILGTNLTGATDVTFNGATAQFKVASPTLILTYVPTGATTGKVNVTLPGGTLSSNVPFYVLK